MKPTFSWIFGLLLCLTACGGEQPTPDTDSSNTQLAPYTSHTTESNTYITPPPNRKTATAIVPAPTAALFLGKWENKSELCTMEVLENKICKIRCSDPDATYPDDIFVGTWFIQGAQLIVELQQEWWHGKRIFMEYDEQQKALYKVQPDGERTYVFSKK